MGRDLFGRVLDSSRVAPRPREVAEAAVVAPAPAGSAANPAQQEEFLDALAEFPNVASAARQAGVPASGFYELKKRDPAFRERWEHALAEGVAVVERAGWRRAVEGVDEPVFYQGNVAGFVKRYSDAIWGRIMQAHHPAYRDRRELDVRARHEVMDWAALVREARLAERGGGDD